MFRLHQSRYIAFIMMMAFAFLQFEASAHSKAHLFDTEDCAMCQILTQNLNIQSPEISTVFSGALSFDYSFFFLNLPPSTIAHSSVLSRAPPP